jgi:hypothetical protein
VYRVPASIDATGSTNVSASMQSFINSVPDDSTIVFPAGSVYRLAGDGIALTRRDGLVLEGEGATLRVTGCTPSDSAFRVDRSSDITIRGFEVIGDHAVAGTVDAHQVGCQYTMGVAIYGALRTVISDMTVSRVSGDCWYVAEASSGWADDVVVKDSSCRLAGRMGVAIVGGRHVTVTRTSFDQIALFPFDIEPNNDSGGASDVAFTDNTIGAYTVDTDDWNPWLFAVGGASGASVDRVTFSGNRATEAALRIKSNKLAVRDLSITNNRSDASASGPVMNFDRVAGIRVTGNTQPLRSGTLATFGSSTNVTYDG